jgi:hypothetical protein
MVYRLHQAAGYAFCLFGLFFFIKNLPLLWHLNTVSHSKHLNGLNLNEEIIFWLKFIVSFLFSVVFPFLIGLSFLKFKKVI